MTFTMFGAEKDSMGVLYCVVPTSMTMSSKPEPCLAKRWLFEERWGLVFACPARLKILEKCGCLTQFDSTHKVNKWKHNMFSFLMKDKHGSWIPAAHCG